eukprot:48374-Pleurochrysis_carterae.AAC.1
MQSATRPACETRTTALGCTICLSVWFGCMASRLGVTRSKSEVACGSRVRGTARAISVLVQPFGGSIGSPTVTKLWKPRMQSWCLVELTGSLSEGAVERKTHVRNGHRRAAAATV